MYRLKYNVRIRNERKRLFTQPLLKPLPVSSFVNGSLTATATFTYFALIRRLVISSSSLEKSYKL